MTGRVLLWDQPTPIVPLAFDARPGVDLLPVVVDGTASDAIHTVLNQRRQNRTPGLYLNSPPTPRHGRQWPAGFVLPGLQGSATRSGRATRRGWRRRRRPRRVGCIH